MSYHLTDHHQRRAELLDSGEDVQRSQIPDGEIDGEKDARSTEAIARRQVAKNHRYAVEKNREHIHFVPEDRRVANEFLRQTRKVHRDDLRTRRAVRDYAAQESDEPVEFLRRVW